MGRKTICHPQEKVAHRLSMVRRRKACIENRQHPLAHLKLLMPLAYTICTAMFWSGVWITGMRIMKMPQQMVLHGWIKMLQKMLGECCAAAPGTTIRGIVAPPLATGSGPTVATPTSVFGFFPPRGFFRSPFLSYTLALYTCYTLPSREARRIFSL
jgi:hypothetical protein